ncbi:hypothetical protein C8Q75DRAFT_801929 [Abortiporus biennis]|nr:hypothetical protein C8Q75DRAFT_801929 [Abortiporus biennis]
MAYPEQYGNSSYLRYPPQQQQHPTQQYNDNMETYNPYDNSQPHRTYDQSGYGMQDNGYAGGYDSAYRDEPAHSKEHTEERSVFENEVPQAFGPKTTSAMRNWRYEHQGNLWTKGGRGRCFGRFFCCTIMIFVFLLVSIVLSLALWIKPPSIQVGQPQLSTTGNTLQFTGNGLNVSLGVDIAVNNPNYFSVNFKEIKADLTYPVNSFNIGGGSIKNLDIKSNQQTNFTFPITLSYNATSDSNFAVLEDIFSHCDGTGQQLTINYKIMLDFRVIVIPIKPTITNQFKFTCPISSSELESFMKGLGINIGDLGSLLSGSKRK